ncbi:MAG TPA: DUF4845 domain-containing protein [Aquabacterium sp.]|nr:DUF4845 domain-containing protein [Aquabacterium sp.]HRH28754.1 DUF4845 domain-containing protein [Aquabacterium sp.]
MSVSHRSVSRRQQRGISLLGLIFWGVVISALAAVVIKVFPVVTEYQTISRMVDKLAREGGSTVPEIRASFDKYKTVEYGIESIGAKDLEISKEDDKIVISFAYDKEVELVDPVYLLIKFKGQSK